MTKIWAHRGSAEHARENTVGAFAAARTLGADGVELDVRCSADEVLVVHHDPRLPTGEPIDRSPANILPRWLPTLEEALEACGELLVNVEVKTDTGDGRPEDPEQRTARGAARFCARWSAPERLVLSSFSLAALEAAREEAPDLELAWLVSPARATGAARDTAPTPPPDPIATVVARRFGALHPHASMVDEALAGRAATAGIPLRAWTPDDPREVARLAGLGVAGVITNDVAGARSALGRVDPPPR